MALKFSSITIFKRLFYNKKIFTEGGALPPRPPPRKTPLTIVYIVHITNKNPSKIL